MIAVALSCQREVQIGVIARSSFAVSFAEGSIVDELGLSGNDHIAVSGAEAPLKLKNGKAAGKVMQSEEYYAVYPASALEYFTPDGQSGAALNIPTVQTAVKGGIPEGTAISVASTSSDDMSLNFESVVSYLKFTVTPDAGKISAISIISQDGARISGEFYVDCNDPEKEVYPLANSASNAVLKPKGNCFEPGDYYVAVLPTVFEEGFYVVVENEAQRFHLSSMSTSSVQSESLVYEIGTIGYLEYPYDAFNRYSTYTSVGQSGGNLIMTFIYNKEFDVEVEGNTDWVHIVKTKDAGLRSFYITVDPNYGKSRWAYVVAEALDGTARVVYNIYQHFDPESQDVDKVRQALIDLYNSTDGDNWKNNENWCSDRPLSEWYGIYTYEELDYQTGGDKVYAVSLSRNNLKGSLPKSIGDLAEVQNLSLYGNPISGTVPSEIFRLNVVGLYDCQLESIDVPESAEDICSSSIDLSHNKISGELPEVFAYAKNLRSLSLYDNQFTGTIPASYTNLISQSKSLHLHGNRLSGRIPDEVCDNPFFEVYMRYILPQNGEGFDLTGSRIDAPNMAYIYDNGTQQIYTKGIYQSNSYTLLCRCNDDEPDPEIVWWYENYKGDGLGVLVYRTQKPYNFHHLGLDWPCVYNLAFANQSVSDFISSNVALIDPDGYYVVNPVTGTEEDVIAVLETAFGKLDPNPDPDPVPPVEYPDVVDGEVTILQTATEGNGIDIVLLGDSYDAQSISEGTYAKVMNEAADYFFETEPFSTYRHLFNVYMVTVVSEDGSALGVTYGEGTSMSGNDERCFSYALKALSSDRLKEALVITVVNSDQFGGSTYMYTSGNGDWASGKAVSYIPKVTLKMDFRGLIQHEAGGHGFAKLADEYVGRNGTSVTAEVQKKIKNFESYGWYGNVDFTDDPSSVKWADILSDERYAAEPEGLYEGALDYSSGVWRPTYTSIMKENQGQFNAPSRKAIWYRIHKLAYGSDWQYTFDSFADYDKKNRLPRRAVYVLRTESIDFALSASKSN